MKSKWLCRLVLFLAVVSHCRVTAGNATLTNNVFNNIVIGISSAIDSDLDAAAIKNFVNIIKNLTTSTSNTLFRATGNRLSFGTGTILGPSNLVNWNVVTKSRTVRGAPPTYNPPTFDTADIRIDLPNAAYGKMPYTQQSRLCGERGDFIHLTTDFIKGNYDIKTLGTPDILLAREWVKYYFGVFDEQGYDYSNMYPVKYFAHGATLTKSICSSSSSINWDDESCGGQSSIQGLPASCTLEVDTTQNITSSMMSLPLAPIAFSFCANASEHNAEAPNKHNVMCDGQSIMEVVLKNTQVQNPTFDVAPPDPVFDVEQFTASVNALVLGILWDNLNDFNTQLYSGYASFVKFLNYDFPIGGTFKVQQTYPIKSGINNTWCKITEDDNSRKTCIGNIPSISTGSPTGNRNLRANFDILTNDNSFPNNIKAILFVSDSSIGEEDSSYMCTTAKTKNFQLFVVSYDSGTVNGFQTQTDCAGFAQAIFIKSPKPLFNSTVWDQDVQDCYGFLQQRKMTDEFLSALPNMAAPMLYGPPQIYYEELLLNSTQTSVSVIDFSTTVTNMTNRFYFESCDNLLSDGFQVRDFVSCSVTGSDATCAAGPTSTYIYCGDQLKPTTYSTVEFQCDSSSINLNGIVQQPPYMAYVVGQPWNAFVDNTVTPSITLKSWVVVSPISAGIPMTTFSSVRIFASLMRGTTPVFNAYVNASVIFGTNSTTLQLRDDGGGNPDVSFQDGIYSAYFTQFGSSSTFAVSVSANDNGATAKYPTETYPWVSKTNSMGIIQIETFSRVASGGSFSLPSISNGNLPPGRIMDLQVQSTSTDTAVLRWTNPGADLDYGNADSFYIKCSTNKDDLSPSNFNPSSQDSNGSPGTPGTKMTHSVGGTVDSTTHYCAVFVCDNLRACSVPSNIVPYSLVQSGLTSGQIAGISIGVIILIIIIVLISVLIFFKCFRKKDKTVSGGNLHSSQTLTGDEKLKPIPIEALPNTAIYQPGYGIENEGAQRHSRPTSHRSNDDSFDSITSKNTQNIGHNVMLSFQNNSRTPSPKPVAIPKVPTSHNNHPMEVIELDSPPSREVIINARPLQAVYERDRPPSNDSTVFFVNNPDVARPVLLTQMATIEDTGDYQDVNFKTDIPVYHHLLNKPTMYTASPGVPPPAPPKKNYGNMSMESHSSDSSSSSSAHTNRTPRHNTQV